MASGDAARLYHELTSYTPEREWTAPVKDPRVVHGFAPNDVERFPAPCKAYPPGLRAVDLPRAWPPRLDPGDGGARRTAPPIRRVRP